MASLFVAIHQSFLGTRVFLFNISLRKAPANIYQVPSASCTSTGTLHIPLESSSGFKTGHVDWSSTHWPFLRLLIVKSVACHSPLVVKTLNVDIHPAKCPSPLPFGSCFITVSQNCRSGLPLLDRTN